MSVWYLYILECEDGKLYTGVTQDLKRRFQEHRSGKGGHYTSSNRPKQILYHESFDDQHSAEEREMQIKRWTHAKKQALIQRDFEKLTRLSVSKD